MNMKIRLKNTRSEFQKVSLLLLIALMFGSCVPYKKLVYLRNDAFKDGIDTVSVYPYKRAEYRLRIDDIVSVQINSADPEMASMFSQDFGNQQNMGNNQMMRSAGGNGDVFYFTGYIVNDSGKIEFPYLGSVKAEGRTVEELRTRLKSELSKYFRADSYFIKVQLGGIRYSMMGEINRPGRFVALESRYNLFQALADAGGATGFADRKNVILIRQYPKGSRIHQLNLLDPNIINSDYYYLRPNDIIYIRPLKSKTYGFGQTFAQNFTLVLSILSTGLAAYAAFSTRN